jgi:hypothetical protein
VLLRGASAALDSRNMRSSISRIAIAWVLACAATGCGDENGDPSDGGGGAGGTGSTPDGSVGDTGSVNCMPGLTAACPTPPVTYGKVQAIIQSRCAGLCHNGTTPDPNDPRENLWGLITYGHVKDWDSLIRDSVGNCSMPPLDAGVPMTVEERQAILEFIRCGSPE